MASEGSVGWGCKKEEVAGRGHCKHLVIRRLQADQARRISRLRRSLAAQGALQSTWCRAGDLPTSPQAAGGTDTEGAHRPLLAQRVPHGRPPFFSACRAIMHDQPDCLAARLGGRGPGNHRCQGAAHGAATPRKSNKRDRRLCHACERRPQLAARHACPCKPACPRAQARQRAGPGTARAASRQFKRGAGFQRESSHGRATAAAAGRCSQMHAVDCCIEVPSPVAACPQCEGTASAAWLRCGGRGRGHSGRRYLRATLLTCWHIIPLALSLCTSIAILDWCMPVDRAKRLPAPHRLLRPTRVCAGKGLSISPPALCLGLCTRPGHSGETLTCVAIGAGPRSARPGLRPPRLPPLSAAAACRRPRCRRTAPCGYNTAPASLAGSCFTGRGGAPAH